MYIVGVSLTPRLCQQKVDWVLVVLVVVGQFNHGRLAHHSSPLTTSKTPLASDTDLLQLVLFSYNMKFSKNWQSVLIKKKCLRSRGLMQQCSLYSRWLALLIHPKMSAMLRRFISSTFSWLRSKTSLPPLSSVKGGAAVEKVIAWGREGEPQTWWMRGLKGWRGEKMLKNASLR